MKEMRDTKVTSGINQNLILERLKNIFKLEIVQRNLQSQNIYC